jgi:arylsulfatase A-like enzyme
MKKISRRDFIKMGWGAIQTALVSSIVSSSGLAAAEGRASRQPNIVILICDAMSAHNLSLYGYPRKTTPNLEKLAEHAFVYHNHYANGNWTTPGTSSLLTGLKPWTHRAINYSATVKKEFSQHNIFRFLGNDYFKLAYTQNYWAKYLLDQFSPNIDRLLPFSEFGLIDADIANLKFKNDLPIFHRAIEKMLYYGNSLLLSFINDLYYTPKTSAEQIQNYPIGFPTSGMYNNIFTMEGLFDGLKKTIIELDDQQSPFFSYFHIFPPHEPYAPNKNFYGMFDNDGYKPIVKKSHPLAYGFTQVSQDMGLDNYDAFIANLDMEIGGLFDSLKEQGILDHTYFIIASDHGEIFERGMRGHGSPLLYEPLIKTPLLILPPGNQNRRDFTSLTNNIDILPTLLNIAGQPIPDSCEGKLLPGLGGEEDPQHSVFTMEAVESSAHKPFTKASYAIIKGQYKLIHYEGYPHKYHNYYEFYDLKEDAEEMQNIFSEPRLAEIVKAMKKELLDSIWLANEKLMADQ